MDKQVIGIIARLVKEKGYVELFEAFADVLKKYPKAILLIIGISEPHKKDSVDIEMVKGYGIKDSIFFLGQKKRVEDFYALMDVFVLPTHREGLGNTILEASAMEKPVIATDIRGCRESVDNGKTGILVPPKDYDKLSEAILSLVKNSELCLKFGKAGRNKINNDFNEDKVFEVVIREYEKLIKEKVCR